MTIKTAASTVSKLNSVMSWVDTQVAGRERMLRVIKIAMMCNEHVLVMGAPGIAKSMVAEKVFQCFKDADTFTIQCTKRMSEENVLGPLNMPLYKEEGVYRYRTEEGIVPCHFAFLDEFLDAPDVVLRSLLGILNERKYRKGPQQEVSNLMTAVCTTNFAPESEALEAVQDRFLFRIKLNPLSGVEGVVGMLEKVFDTKAGKKPLMGLTDLKTLQRSVKNVEVTKSIYRIVGDFAVHARTAGSSGLDITDRRIVKAITAIKAAAVLDGRSYVTPKDLWILEHVFQIDGDDRQGQSFASHFTKHIAPTMGHHGAYSTYYKSKAALENIAADVQEAVDNNDSKAIDKATKIVNAFIMACNRDRKLQSALPEEIALLEAEAKSYLTALEA